MTDDCGNINSVSVDQLITVQDNIAPTQTFPNLPTDTLYLNLDCAVDLVPAAMPMQALDNCDSEVAASVTYEDDPDSTTCSGRPMVEIETVAEHMSGELAGMNTYHIYAGTAGAGDFPQFCER